MDLTHLPTLKRLCRQYGVRPDPDAGQHFLISREVLQTAIQAAELERSDAVLEVGAGFGTLTIELARQAGRVIAVELDQKLYAAAQEILKPYVNVDFINANFLTLPPATYNLQPTTYKLVANLPYGITGRFFRHVFTAMPQPSRIVVMVQAEVAERIASSPGSLSLLGVLCQLHGQVSVVTRVPRHAFWPAPAVDSALITIRVHPRDHLSRCLQGMAAEDVMRLVRVGFSSRRKTLVNNLIALTSPTLGRAGRRRFVLQALGEQNLPPTVRAQEVTVQQWISLAKIVKNCLI